MKGRLFLVVALLATIMATVCGPPACYAEQFAYQDMQATDPLGAASAEGTNDVGSAAVQVQGVLSSSLAVDLSAIVVYQLKDYRYHKHAIPAIGQGPEVLDPGSTGDASAMLACNLGKRVRAGIRWLLCCG
jgi:hypothetical protein